MARPFCSTFLSLEPTEYEDSGIGNNIGNFENVYNLFYDQDNYEDIAKCENILLYLIQTVYFGLLL